MSTFYRVDRRNLTDADLVEPEGTYQERFVDAGKTAEEILDRVRAAKFPAKPQRGKMLFVTDDKACAEQYWRTHDKSYLYEVSIEKSHIGHRGDMNWVDMIGGELRKSPMQMPDETKIEAYANQYWNGDQTDSPCREVLVTQARVIKRTHDLSDLKSYVRQHVRGISDNPSESMEDLLGGEPDEKN